MPSTTVIAGCSATNATAATLTYPVAPFGVALVPTVVQYRWYVCASPASTTQYGTVVLSASETQVRIPLGTSNSASSSQTQPQLCADIVEVDGGAFVSTANTVALLQPTTTTGAPPPNAAATGSSGSFPLAIVAGAAAGGVLLILIVLVVLLRRRRKNRAVVGFAAASTSALTTQENALFNAGKGRGRMAIPNPNYVHTDVMPEYEAVKGIDNYVRIDADETGTDTGGHDVFYEDLSALSQPAKSRQMLRQAGALNGAGSGQPPVAHSYYMAMQHGGEGMYETPVESAGYETPGSRPGGARGMRSRPVEADHSYEVPTGPRSAAPAPVAYDCIRDSRGRSNGSRPARATVSAWDVEASASPSAEQQFVSPNNDNEYVVTASPPSAAGVHGKSPAASSLPSSSSSSVLPVTSPYLATNPDFLYRASEGAAPPRPARPSSSSVSNQDVLLPAPYLTTNPDFVYKGSSSGPSAVAVDTRKDAAPSGFTIPAPYVTTNPDFMYKSSQSATGVPQVTLPAPYTPLNTGMHVLYRGDSRKARTELSGFGNESSADDVDVDVDVDVDADVAAGTGSSGARAVVFNEVEYDSFDPSVEAPRSASSTVTAVAGPAEETQRGAFSRSAPVQQPSSNGNERGNAPPRPPKSLSSSSSSSASSAPELPALLFTRRSAVSPRDSDDITGFEGGSAEDSTLLQVPGSVTPPAPSPKQTPSSSPNTGRRQTVFMPPAATARGARTQAANYVQMGPSPPTVDDTWWENRCAPTISRVEAERLVSAGGDGDFVIRNETKGSNRVLTRLHRGAVIHRLIKQLGPFVSLDESFTNRFDSIRELVHFYQFNRLPEGGMLNTRPGPL
jgi:hypothetical protein